MRDTSYLPDCDICRARKATIMSGKNFCGPCYDRYTKGELDDRSPEERERVRKLLRETREKMRGGIE